MSDHEFQTKAEELAHTQGIHLDEHVGTISGKGVTAGYTHANGTLTVHIIDKPSYISRAYCERRIEEWLGVPQHDDY